MLCCNLFLAGALFFSTLSFAGQACEQTSADVYSLKMALNSGLQLQQTLIAQQPELALVARVGQDLSAYNLRYSHIALLRKDPESGQWRVYHLLNQCGSNQSALWQEGLANFFMDTPFKYDAVLLIPSPETQRKLVKLLNQPNQYRALFTPNYNMLAYPFSTRYQNSNQWVLEVLANAFATSPLYTREQAQQWLLQAGYQATTLNIPTFKRLGARMFRANIAFDDHPTQLRFSDQINTVTVDSVMKFILQQDKQTTVIELAAPDPEQEIQLPESI